VREGPLLTTANDLICSDEVTGDVFDLLLSLSDFEEFKQLMLACKEDLKRTGE
jgi:hypothetical protein